MLSVPDQTLAQAVLDSFREERKCQRVFLEKLGRFDERKLYLPLGHSSIFAYCTRTLGLSEASAAKRIVVARLARRFPVFLERIEQGGCTLTSLWILAPIFTAENVESIVPRLKGMTRFQAEQIKASIQPGVERRPVIRLEPVRGHIELRPPLPPQPPASAELNETLPTARTNSFDDGEVTAPTRSIGGAMPSSSRRVGFHFTASETLLSKFRRAQTLMRHRFPKGDPENVFSEALDALLDRVDPDRRLPTARASHRSESRRVPDGLRLRVWHRDGGRCTFLGTDGRRCASEELLEVDHIRPWSLGGKTEMNNLRLLCAPHHRYYTLKTFPEGPPSTSRRENAGAPSAIPRNSA